MHKKVLLLFFIFAVYLSFAAYTTYNFSGRMVTQNGSSANNPGCTGIADSAGAIVNVSVYKQVAVANFPPSLTYNSSNITNATGHFLVYFNVEDADAYTLFSMVITRTNCTGALLQMGPSLPPFPATMYSLLFNNSNITLYNASTFYLNATNSTGGITNYSGMLTDARSGFMVKSFMSGGNTGDGTQNLSVNLLSNRNYTLTITKFGNMQANERGAAPRGFTITTDNLTTQANSNKTFPLQVAINDTVVDVTGNLTVNVSGLNGTDNINYTKVILYPYFSGKVPITGPGIDPVAFGGQKNADFSAQLNFTPFGRGASYNLTAMASASGLSYMLVIYAYNGSAPGADGTRYFAGFQNITLYTGTNLTSFNITLYELAGNLTTYYSSSSYGGSNTTFFTLTLKNNDSNNMNVDSSPVEITVNYTNPSGHGSVDMSFIAQSNSTGQISFPIFKDTKFKFKIYGQQFAPTKKKINSTANLTTVFLTGRNFHRPNSTEMYTSLSMLFLKSNSTCNIQHPDLRDDTSGGCLIANFTAGSTGNFNPMKIMMSGENLNLIIKDTATGVTGIFVGTDLFASGPPNMQLPNEATSDTSSDSAYQKAWRFGSVAPEVFSYAYLGIPYTDASVDDQQTMNIRMTSLYDEDWNQQWTAVQGSDAVPSDFSDYNTSFFIGSGLACSTTDITSDCYVNTSANMIWVKVPHFSGSDPQVGGSVRSSVSSSSGSSHASLSVDFTSPTKISCPNNTLELIATSSGQAISSVLVRLILYEPYLGVRQEKLTNEEGKIIFDLTDEQDGRYQVDSYGSGYAKPEDRFFDFSHCIVAVTGLQEILVNETPAAEQTPAREQPTQVEEPLSAIQPDADIDQPTQTAPAKSAIQPTQPPVKQQETETPPQGQKGIELWQPILGLIALGTIAIIIYYFAFVKKGKRYS